MGMYQLNLWSREKQGRLGKIVGSGCCNISHMQPTYIHYNQSFVRLNIFPEGIRNGLPNIPPSSPLSTVVYRLCPGFEICLLAPTGSIVVTVAYDTWSAANCFPSDFGHKRGVPSVALILSLTFRELCECKDLLSELKNICGGTFWCQYDELILFLRLRKQ